MFDCALYVLLEADRLVLNITQLGTKYHSMLDSALYVLLEADRFLPNRGCPMSLCREKYKVSLNLVLSITQLGTKYHSTWY
jgi:hypothetical protein